MRCNRARGDRARHARDRCGEIPETLQGAGGAHHRCRPTTSKPCSAPPSLVGFFQSACSPIYMNKEQSIDLRLHSRNCNGREFIQSREQQKRQKRWLKKAKYIFKHAITHDVAYDSMLFARARKLHQLAAEAIEALFPAGSRNSPLRWISL